MLDFLWITGKIMVAGRKGGQKQWDLSERCLPDWTPRDPVSQRELVKRAAQKSVASQFDSARFSRSEVDSEWAGWIHERA